MKKPRSTLYLTMGMLVVVATTNVQAQEFSDSAAYRTGEVMRWRPQQIPPAPPQQVIHAPPQRVRHTSAQQVLGNSLQQTSHHLPQPTCGCPECVPSSGMPGPVDYLPDLCDGVCDSLCDSGCDSCCSGSRSSCAAKATLMGFSRDASCSSPCFFQSWIAGIQRQSGRSDQRK